MDAVQLFRNIKGGKIGSLYLFYGPENLLIREAVDKIRAALIPEPVKEFNLTVIDGSSSTAEDIINACETLPFMNEKRLVTVNDAPLALSGGKGFTKEEIQMLQDCFKDIPSYTCLIITAKINPDMRTKLIKTVKAFGHIVEFGRLKPAAFERWAAKRFADGEKTVSSAALKRFVELTGYRDRDSGKTLEGVSNEIKKILKYCGARTEIKIEDVEALAPDNFHFNIFSLVDSIGEKDFEKSFTLLGSMKQSKEPPIRVLFMIVRQFRLLLQVFYLREMSYSGKMIASRLRLPPFVAGSLIKQTDNFTQDELKNALKECAKIDARIKSGRVEPWLALELFIAGL